MSAALSDEELQLLWRIATGGRVVRGTDGSTRDVVQHTITLLFRLSARGLVSQPITVPSLIEGRGYLAAWADVTDAGRTYLARR